MLLVLNIRRGFFLIPFVPNLLFKADRCPFKKKMKKSSIKERLVIQLLVVVYSWFNSTSSLFWFTFKQNTVFNCSSFLTLSLILLLLYDKPTKFNWLPFESWPIPSHRRCPFRMDISRGIWIVNWIYPMHSLTQEQLIGLPRMIRERIKQKPMHLTRIKARRIGLELLHSLWTANVRDFEWIRNFHKSEWKLKDSNFFLLELTS